MNITTIDHKAKPIDSALDRTPVYSSSTKPKLLGSLPGRFRAKERQKWCVVDTTPPPSLFDDPTQLAEETTVRYHEVETIAEWFVINKRHVLALRVTSRSDEERLPQIPGWRFA